MTHRTGRKCRHYVLFLPLILTAPAIHATTSYSFGSENNITLALETPAYTTGTGPTSAPWTEVYPGGGQQLDCVVAVGSTTITCGNGSGGDGTGSAASGIPIYSGPGGTLPANTTNYLEVDGDPTYGAPVWTLMSGLTSGDTYQVSFYQASNEESLAQATAYTDSWSVYILPSGTNPFICVVSCSQTGYTSQAANPDPSDLVWAGATLAPISNPGGQSTSWEQETFDFVANASSETLEFVANSVGNTPFQPPLLDLAAVTTTQVSPEPESWVLVTAGLGFLAFRRRFRRRA